MDALSTAHAATDKALDAMEKYVRSIYLRSVREIYKSWQKFFEQERKEIDKLQEDYEKAKKSGDKTLTKKAGIALTREKKKETVQNKWFSDMVKQTAENLLHVNETAVSYLNGRLPETYVTNFNAVGELCENAVTGYSYHIVDENTVRELAMSDTSLLPYKEIDPAKDIAWNVRQMKSEVLQGILQGEDMQAIANRLSNVIGMNENSAVRNARTMVTSAENKGRQDGFYQAEEDGIILEKYWLCVHGERTREAHAAAGNDYSKSKSIPQSQPFIVGGEKLMFPGDKSMGASGWNLYNCRCSMAAVVKGFKKAQVEKDMAEKQAEEPKADSFVPAKKKAEAEMIANQFGVNADYSKYDISVANAMNETMQKYVDIFGKHAFDNLDEISTFAKGEKLYEWGGYSSKNRSIKIRGVNSKNAIEKFGEKMKKYQDRFFSSDSNLHIIRHELGHAVHDVVDGTVSKELMKYRRSVSLQINKDVSIRADWDDYEFVAECLAQYLNGNPSKIAIDVVEILKKGFKYKFG